jgi:hypothetical protein
MFFWIAVFRSALFDVEFSAGPEDESPDSQPMIRTLAMRVLDSRIRENDFGAGMNLPYRE